MEAQNNPKVFFYKSTRGADKVAILGYSYTFDRNGTSKTIWIILCENCGCTGRMHLDLANKPILFKDHPSHPPDSVDIEVITKKYFIQHKFSLFSYLSFIMHDMSFVSIFEKTLFNKI